MVCIPDRVNKALQVMTNKENEVKNIFYRVFKGCHKMEHEYCESVLRGLAELEMAPGDETGERLTARGLVPGLLLRNAEPGPRSLPGPGLMLGNIRHSGSTLAQPGGHNYTQNIKQNTSHTVKINRVNICDVSCH